MAISNTAFQKLDIEERLGRQMEYAAGVTGRLREFVLDFLNERRISSLDDVTQEDMVYFRKYANMAAAGNRNAKSLYGSLLEQAVFAYLIGKAREGMGKTSRSSILILADECISDSAVRNKTVGYLLLSGIWDVKDVDYEVRVHYEAYLTETIAQRKVQEYVKALDQLKLADIKEEGKKPFVQKELQYSPERMFLLYHPDYEIAQSFYYVQDKEDLVFDFSLPGAEKMKMQVFQMLNHVLVAVSDAKDRRGRFLLPLNALYRFCLDNDIDDIEQVTEPQVQAFRKSIDGSVGTKTDEYMQIVWNIRRFLFLSAHETNWDAMVWFLERFKLADGRMNPAREVKTLDFSDIKLADNRALFQMHMKYLLAISPKKTVQTIRGAYYHILDFVRYMDRAGAVVTDVTKEIMKEYILFLDEKPIQPETYNKALADIMGFYNYLVSKKKAGMMPIRFEYYFKTTYEKHHNRSVPEEEFNRNLRVINGFPMHLRIMCLIIFVTGLRISEVCILRGDALAYDGKDAWLKVYQTKMKADKRIPIPMVIYEMVTKYVRDNHIKAEEYIFRNKRGGAYDAGTFYQQVNDCFEESGLKGYKFKPHDYRHTTASKFYAEGIAISVIRDYLGHRDSRMTRQYIDEMQMVVDGLSREYFEKDCK